MEKPFIKCVRLIIKKIMAMEQICCVASDRRKNKSEIPPQYYPADTFCLLRKNSVYKAYPIFADGSNQIPCPQ